MINVKLQPVKDTIKKYGDKQLIVAIEELSELQKELCKHLRGKTDRKHIVEETADVIIMVSNIREYFSITDAELSDMVADKQQRTIKRMQSNDL